MPRKIARVNNWLPINTDFSFQATSLFWLPFYRAAHPEEPPLTVSLNNLPDFK